MRRRTTATVAALFTTTTLAVAVTGCGGGGSDTGTASPAPPVTPAWTADDLPERVRRMAAALDEQTEVYRTAVAAWSDVTDADRARLWSAMEEERRCGNDLEAMLRAHPTWVASMCEWYESVLRKPVETRAGIQGRLAQQADADSHRRSRLMIEAAPSRDAVRVYTRFSLECAGSPTNLYILCVKFGHIEG